MAVLLENNHVKFLEVKEKLSSPSMVLQVDLIQLPFGEAKVDFKKINLELPISANLLLEEYIEKAELDNFFSVKKTRVIKQLNLTNSLGILFHGIPGTAKTTTALAIANYMVQNNNCTLFIVKNFKEITASLGFIENLEKEYGYCYPIFFIDECEEDFSYHVDEYKTFLDGVNSINNSIILACTNYFEEIPTELTERPSRFKYCVEIKGLTNLKFIKQVMVDMNNSLNEEDKLSEEVINNLVKSCYEKTMDDLKHLFLNAVFTI
jgi:SpoVK/Ycf46/Vps4 family AAA+-type ATPase